MADMVNHPDHYQSADGIEAIDVIAAFTSKLSGVEAFDAGSAIKYLLRFQEKGGKEDLEKCIWYIRDLIERRYLKSEKFIGKDEAYYDEC